MKIVEQSSTRLVLENRPWLIGALALGMAGVSIAGSFAGFLAGKPVVGAILALVGGGVPLALAAVVVQRVRLTLDRATGKISRTRQSVLGWKEQVYDLARLTGAQLGVDTDSEGTTWRMELLLADPAESVPLTLYFTSGDGPRHMCDAVNRWLQGEPVYRPATRF